MAEVHVAGELGASVDEVWKLVSDFGGMLEAMGVPVELMGPEGIGQERKIAMGPEPTVERLEELDNDAQRLVYSIQSIGPASRWRTTSRQCNFASRDQRYAPARLVEHLRSQEASPRSRHSRHRRHGISGSGIAWLRTPASAP